MTVFGAPLNFACLTLILALLGTLEVLSVMV